MQTFKLFVSSPGDVVVERRRVESVVSRLNGDFAGVAQLEAIRWETEFYQAHGTFQAQIPRSTECDLVIGILRWRLGTELPPDFAEKLPGDRPFPSGTAYEILSAIEQRQKGGRLPDIYLFRFAGGSPPVQLDDPNRTNIERNWQALKDFFEEWFLTARGHFKAAFNQYDSEDDFETQLERLLRKWIADKVAGGHVVRWPIAVKGSPFCGLAAFGTKHAPVFFGRTGDIGRALDLWRDAGNRGAPYLVVIGASGSGKSSLARAGLMPRLITPGVIKDVDGWRVAVMRPGDSPSGPFAALAAALMQDNAALPKEEEGRGPALPEIAQGDSQTSAELVSVLRNPDAAAAIKPILNALARIGAVERDRERHGREVRCDLVLLIDQFEELFDAAVSDADRNAFVDVVAALVGTGHVWVVTTLRADFYALMVVQPGLKKLKELGATYDLAPPGPVELAEIVRGPAEAAGLVFESDAATGERLDARLLRDAERPDMLPLVELALSRLFDGRETSGGDIVLPLRVYDGLGGLKGIVDEAGEKALASLGEAEKAQLPRLLRQLAVPAHEQDGIVKGALSIRAMPLAQFATEGDAATRTLIAALIDARLLTTIGTAADAQVRLTHQRVLEDWSRARAIVAESADFYRIRAELEESRRKWEAGKRRKELLLPRGLPLAEAASIVGKYGNELAPEALAYVRASHQRAQRAHMIGWSLAVFFFVLAVGTAGAGIMAYRAQQQAQASLMAATRTANSLVFDLAKRFRDTVGVPASLIKDLLDKALALQNQLAKSGQVTPLLKRIEASALAESVETLLAIGDTDGALAAAERARQIMAELLAGDPGNTDYQLVLGMTYEELGDAQAAQGKLADAQSSYQNGLIYVQRVARSNPNKAEWQLDEAISYRMVGDTQKAQGKLADALTSYQAGLDIMQPIAKTDPDNTIAARELSASEQRVGDVLLQHGKLADALTYYQASAAITERLAKADPGNAGLQRDLTISYDNIGDVLVKQGKLDDALASYQADVTIAVRLANSDPGNAGWQNDLAGSYRLVGDVLVAQGKLADGLASYQAALGIAQRLTKSDPGNAGWQSDLAISYRRVGDAQEAEGKLDDALASFQAGIGVMQRLTKSDSGHGDWQSELSALYQRVGDVQVKQGKQADALTSFQASLAIIEHLANSYPAHAGWQRDLSLEYARIGEMDLAQGKLADALTSYQAELIIAERLAKSDPSDTQWQTDLAIANENVGDLEVQQGQLDNALASYQSELTIFDRVSKADPSNADWQHGLLASYGKVGSVYLAQGKLDEALTSYQANLAISERLAKSDPDNAGWQRDLLLAYDHVGEVQVAQGNLTDGLNSYRQGLAISERLAGADPSNAGWQQDLKTLYREIGDVQMSQGQFADALASYQASLAIAERLTKSDPNKADWQRDLLVANNGIGDAQFNQGQLSDALTAYHAELAIVERLAAPEPGNAEWQYDLAAVYGRTVVVQVHQNNLAGALQSYHNSLRIAQRLLSIKSTSEQWQNGVNDLIREIGGLAANLLLAHDFDDALQAADEAISLKPDLRWLYLNRAHALMFAGRTDEARALYLKYRGETILEQDGKSWQAIVLEDFAQFREVGLTNPLMDEIEKLFRSAG